MPKPVPSIAIRADTREVQSGIPGLLETTYGVQVEIAQLPVGDYELGGTPLRVVERKTAPDFVASIADQRVFAQVEALLASGVAPLIVLEGDWSSVPSQMHPNAIRGALTYLTGILAVPLLPSPSPTGTAALLASLAKQLQVGYQQPGGASPARKAKTLEDQQISVLTALPGIGPSTARALLAHFGSIQQVLLASAEELATISGITPARAARLIDILRTPHVPEASEKALPEQP